MGGTGDPALASLPFETGGATSNFDLMVQGEDFELYTMPADGCIVARIMASQKAVTNLGTLPAPIEDIAEHCPSPVWDFSQRVVFDGGTSSPDPVRGRVDGADGGGAVGGTDPVGCADDLHRGDRVHSRHQLHPGRLPVRGVGRQPVGVAVCRGPFHRDRGIGARRPRPAVARTPGSWSSCTCTWPPPTCPHRWPRSSGSRTGTMSTSRPARCRGGCAAATPTGPPAPRSPTAPSTSDRTDSPSWPCSASKRRHRRHPAGRVPRQPARQHSRPRRR